jgi:hypothetical protein
MEDSNEDPRRMMCIGRFTYRWAYQYYTMRKGRAVKFIGDRLHWYKEDQVEFYFRGEEEEAWLKLKSKKHETKTKKVIIEDKLIEHMYDSGYSLVDKNGNIIKK